MAADFSLILLALCALTGLVWLLDVAWLRRRRRRRQGEEAAEPWAVDWARALFPVLALVFVLRSFVAEPFRIPSGSMMPTLRVGDFILVNKFAYGLRLPVWHTKFLSLGEPRRGDVVVFRPPWKPEEDWIKRIVGLPGDHVVVRGEKVWINGKQLHTDMIGPYNAPGDHSREAETLRAYRATVSKETLGQVRHTIVQMPAINARDGGAPGVPGPFNPPVVPAHCYFVMGDNRDDSADSRYHGCVPAKDMVGKAFMIWFSWDHGVAFSRIGSLIH
ncbi:signal peptidase I [Oleiagrimonas sp. C23AA]|uniref:signal peptidase I n=1 Tax=Oleiagrimonas sp. C23AA TaxID=2719047 RepID=UPI00141FBD5C|nr:signal peptidase I [Oleiagrimonas sp. C23AA]